MRRPSASKTAALAVVSVVLAGIPDAPCQVRVMAAADRIPLGLDAYMPVPEDNPLTPEKVALGRRLFNERLLSRDKSIACSTCHDPKRAFTDAEPFEGESGLDTDLRFPSA